MRWLKWAVVVCVLAVAGIAALGHSCLTSKRPQPKTSAGELDRDHGRHSPAGWRQFVRSSNQASLAESALRVDSRR